MEKNPANNPESPVLGGEMSDIREFWLPLATISGKIRLLDMPFLMAKR